ncbi:MAG: YDG domain-containing protein, partial [Candidatus Omnitrophota bacterium]
FADKNVASGISVSVTGYTLAGADSANYAIIQPQGLTADITAKTVTVSGTFTADNKVYDGTTAATILTNNLILVGVEGGDVVNLIPVAEFADPNVGIGITVSLTENSSLDGADAGNYSLSLAGAPTTTANITSGELIELTISGTFTADPKIYNGNASAAININNLNLVGVEPGDIVTLIPVLAFNDKGVASGKTVSITAESSLGGPDAGKYYLSLTGAPITTSDITAKELTVTASGVNKVYDGTTNATVILSDNRVAGDVFTDNYASASFEDKNVGNNKTVNVAGISIVGLDAGNYMLSSTTAVTTANITPAVVGTVTWTGAVSSAWNNPLNWDSGVVPSAEDKVIIPPTANQPQLSSAVTIKELIINSGETFSTGGNSLTVNENVTIGGILDAGASVITIKGNLIATGSSIIGTNPTLYVSGYIGTINNPINISVSGTLNIYAGGILDKISISIKGSGLYNFQGNIPGFVLTDGKIMNQIGQYNFRASLAQQESSFYQPALSLPVSVPVLAGAVPVFSMGPKAAPVPMIMTVPTTAPVYITAPALPAAHVAVPRVLPSKILTEAVPPALLFKQVIVKEEVLKLSSPEIFREMTVSARINSLANFREVIVYSNKSRIVTPDVFHNISIIPQIADKPR